MAASQTADDHNLWKGACPAASGWAGEWLRADCKPQDFRCRPDEDPSCSLHLHGVTDNWGPFYTSKNAIGLVMATGNVGHYLSDKEDEVPLAPNLPAPNETSR